MSLEEFYTPVGCHFGYGCNTEIFLAKGIFFILMYVFEEVASDGSSYHYGNYIVPYDSKGIETRHRPSSHAQKQERE